MGDPGAAPREGVAGPGAPRGGVAQDADGGGAGRLRRDGSSPHALIRSPHALICSPHTLIHVTLKDLF